MKRFVKVVATFGLLTMLSASSAMASSMDNAVKQTMVLTLSGDSAKDVNTPGSSLDADISGLLANLPGDGFKRSSDPTKGTVVYTVGLPAKNLSGSAETSSLSAVKNSKTESKLVLVRPDDLLTALGEHDDVTLMITSQGAGTIKNVRTSNTASRTDIKGAKGAQSVTITTDVKDLRAGSATILTDGPTSEASGNKLINVYLKLLALLVLLTLPLVLIKFMLGLMR